MALQDQHQLQVINEISEALSSTERRRLLYLLESLDMDSSVVCTKEMLKCAIQHHEMGHLLLRELILRLSRFDLLRKVCKTSRDEVERSLSSRQILPKFRVLVSNLSEDLSSDDLSSIKFLLGGTLPRDKLEKSKSFLDVAIELEKLDLVSPERVDLLKKCFINISRVDLAKKVTAYEMSAVTAEQQSSQQRQQWSTTNNHSSARPFSHPIASPPQPQTRQGQSLCSAAENRPVSTVREPRCQVHPDLYKFNTNPRGVCIIIDCVGKDGDMLEHTFKALHFDVVTYKWLSVNDIRTTLSGLVMQREKFHGDGFACCIISRGTTNHLLGTDMHGMGLHLNEVRGLFTADKCQMLAGKPKLFFIQRYSVPDFQPCNAIHYRDEDLETDGCDAGPRFEYIPTDADVFWSHCWADERQLEDERHHSIYLKALTDALRRGQKRKMHLVDVHTEVNGAIFDYSNRSPEAKYHIELKHTLRKDLYLQ
ncbi:uncharacterized protein V6R79_024174 [Siganus canaliculatus]